MQHEVGGLQTHGTVIEHHDLNQSNKSWKVQLNKNP